MSDRFAGFREELAALDREFADRLPGRLDTIDNLWRSLATSWKLDQLDRLTRQVHMLSGSAASFGFPELSRAAAACEQIFKLWKVAGRTPSDEDLREGSALIAALRRAIEHRVPVERLPAATRERPRSSLVYLVEDDRELAEELSLQLASFGYRVEVFTDSLAVAKALADQRPDALVVDIILPTGNLAGIALLLELRQELDLRELPILFITARDDFEARLAAVRCGGAAYFVKPVDVMRLVDRLNRLTQVHGSEPFRILIVDDDATLAEHYALVLRRGGMQVAVVTRPLEVLDYLERETPELVLMDVNMPECSGPELVSLLRQYDRFVSLPILYLSTETDLELRLSALRMGGDDFLTKPMTDHHLFAAVSIKAERSRVLTALMTRDRLTGLVSHVPFKERLAAELARAERQGEDLAFAMLDVDAFKKVNDLYGHLAGDRVLRSLANLLRKRVRLSDTVGRYGGEEFGIVLPDCRLDDAVQLVDELRASFARIPFRAGDDEFRVTFSGGVAAAEPGALADAVIDRADRALYRAKTEGKDRVLASDG